MSNKDWKQKRLDEINLDISNQLDRYVRECKAQNYIEEYHEILKSNAKSLDQFKKESVTS
jgi:hypothetical protein